MQQGRAGRATWEPHGFPVVGWDPMGGPDGGTRWWLCAPDLPAAAWDPMVRPSGGTLWCPEPWVFPLLAGGPEGASQVAGGPGGGAPRGRGGPGGGSPRVRWGSRGRHPPKETLPPTHTNTSQTNTKTVTPSKKQQTPEHNVALIMFGVWHH